MWSEERVAQFVNRQLEPEFRRIAAWESQVLKTWLGRLPPGTLVDAPCGYGRLFDLWAESSRRVSAIDSSPEMCRRARVNATRVGLDATVIEGEIPHANMGEAAVAVCVRLWAHLAAPLADRAMGWLLNTAPFVLLQINESNGSPESSAILQNGQHRLDSIDRIARVLETTGGSIRAVKRCSPNQWTTSLLLIERRRVAVGTMSTNGAT